MTGRVVRLTDAFPRAGRVRSGDVEVPLLATEGGGGHHDADGRPLGAVLAAAGLEADRVPVLVADPGPHEVVTPCVLVRPGGFEPGWLAWETPPQPALATRVVTDDLVLWEGHSSSLVPLFVYGTLQPGEVRWFALRDSVAGEPTPAEVEGAVWDTGYGYPAWTPEPAGVVPGRLLHLRPERAVETWRVVCEVEGGVEGTYVPALVLTAAGEPALAFRFDDDPSPFVRIAAWHHGPVPLPG